MKYIDLTRTESEGSYLNSVLDKGCGPNFIRNRADLFEKMIKEQGLEFWFRFWLTFCLHHNVEEFEEFEEAVPGWIMAMCQVIHYHFVEVSSKDAMKFCWNTILRHKVFTQILSITPIDYNTPMKKKSIFYRQQFADLSSEFIQITFGCALGEIFYKWLYADTSDNVNRRYWTLPQRYLEPNFKPGILEKFLVNKWGIKLARFFGVSLEKLPWIRQLLRYDKDVLKTINDPLFGKQTSTNVELQTSLEKQMDVWKAKVKSMRTDIEGVDEARKEDFFKGQLKIHLPKSSQELCVKKKHGSTKKASSTEILRNRPTGSILPPLSPMMEPEEISRHSSDKYLRSSQKHLCQFKSCTNTAITSNRSRNSLQRTDDIETFYCPSSFPNGYKIDFF